jgi:hypothetical protein
MPSFPIRIRSSYKKLVKVLRRIISTKLYYFTIKINSKQLWLSVPVLNRFAAD